MEKTDRSIGKASFKIICYITGQSRGIQTQFQKVLSYADINKHIERFQASNSIP